MGSILNIATSSLAVFQKALATTSNNIVNAGTEGYSRQRVDFTSRPSQRYGEGFVGRGVEISDIRRFSDEFALLQMRTASSTNEASKAIFEQAVSLDLLLSNDATNVATSADAFFGAVQNLVDDPSYLPGRQTLLSQGEILSESYNTMYNQLIEQQQRIDTTIMAKVDEVNTITKSIADLNVKLSGNTNRPPELLDERDRLLTKLTEIVSANILEQSDGSLLVTVGNGQVLVTSSSVSQLSATRNVFDQSVLDISLGTDVITNEISGGTLGGLIEYREETLDIAKNRLGRMAINLTEQFNNQHQMGMDLDGNLGADFFRSVNDASVILQRAAGSTNNTGTLDLSVTIADSTQLTDDDYQLLFDGANYQLTNLSTNVTNVFGALPIAQDGFSINLVGGAPAAGDQFLITPTKYGANDLSVVTVDPQRIAVAQPMRAITSNNNLGDGVISQGEMSSRANFVATGQPDLPISITFTAANVYEVRDGGGVLIHGGIPYNPAIENDLFPTPAPTNYDPGFRFTLKGDPEVGDTFTIEANTGGTDDSRNAFLLADIPENRSIEGGRYTLQEAYGQIITFVGNQANQASVNEKSSAILLEQAQDRVSAASEVNLEEEAANLLFYQQLFTASSQLINTMNEIFDILNATFSR